MFSPRRRTIADLDLDEPAHRLLDELRTLQGLRLHCLLCRLANDGYRHIGGRRLHAVADELTEDGQRDATVIDLLRFVAEIDAIETLGLEGAAKATDPRQRSETARHFGYAKSVLRHAARACLRQHRW